MITPLRERGFAVLPTPRHVELGNGVVRIDNSWNLQLAGVGADDIAVETLAAGLAEHRLRLHGSGGMLRLEVRAGAVPVAVSPRALAGKPPVAPMAYDADCERQAYSLAVHPDRVEVVGNSPAGLFYGVQTLLQLLEGNGREKLVLPVGIIRDWPALPLRIVHWDTKHHQDRPETLRRFVDWMGRFKLNAVSFELEDKFEYPSHPRIGAPEAFTVAEMQELTRYALRRHVQIIPNIQAPAHMSFVLKHPEFAYLKCDGSNYLACTDQPEAMRLILDMYDDACAATPGVEYFHVSTDEVYYAGICEKSRPYNPVNRSLHFVEFVKKAHEHLAAKGRRIIIWAEFPLLAEHIHLLPEGIIDGIVGGAGFIEEEAKRNIRQLAYAPVQGEEMLFPNYFLVREDHGGGGSAQGRLADAYESTTGGKAMAGRPLGTFAAAWDDSGLHNETFWLGWAAMAQYGWSPAGASTDQTAADFMDLYHGRQVSGMAGVYRRMQRLARRWQGMWDRVPSRVRGFGYGWSQKKTPAQRWDLMLAPPAILAPAEMKGTVLWQEKYAKLLAEAPGWLGECEELIAKLHESISRTDRNRHTLEVFLSLAYLMRHGFRMVGAVGEAEAMALSAQEARAGGDAARAADLLRQARQRVADTVEERRTTLRMLEEVWEKSRYPRNRDVGGREFLHVMDDVKDHIADRRRDLSYMTAPEESMGL